MKKRIFSLSLLVLFNCLPICAKADTAMANQYLQRAINALNTAKIDVIEAQQQQPNDQRVVFHFNWTIQDINKIEGGIEQKFDMPRIQPRVISPIKGDYLSIVGEGN